MKPIDVIIEPLHNDEKLLPSIAYEGDACIDIKTVEDIEVFQDLVTMAKCGFKMQLPPGYEAQIRPRSGLAKKIGLTVVNSPGTIDSSFRGEVCVLLTTVVGIPRKDGDSARVQIPKGTRIAQMCVKPVPQVNYTIGKVNQTERGEKGFGSSGN